MVGVVLDQPFLAELAVLESGGKPPHSKAHG
jgi:hypothetical protein